VNQLMQGIVTCSLSSIRMSSILRPLRYMIIALLLTSPVVFGTALTAILNAHERSCYYADVDGVGEKIGPSLFTLEGVTCTDSRFLLCRTVWREFRSGLYSHGPG
jgi:hypothetical protein